MNEVDSIEDLLETDFEESFEEYSSKPDSQNDLDKEYGFTESVSSAAENSHSPLLNSADIELMVSCEVGQVTLSLGQLMQLKVGDSLEFMRWPGKVKLRVNNNLFAEGYMVEVNGMLGVKITNRIGQP